MRDHRRHHDAHRSECELALTSKPRHGEGHRLHRWCGEDSYRAWPRRAPSSSSRQSAVVRPEHRVGGDLGTRRGVRCHTEEAGHSSTSTTRTTTAWMSRWAVGSHPAVGFWMFGGDAETGPDGKQCYADVKVWREMAKALADNGANQPIGYHTARGANAPGLQPRAYQVGDGTVARHSHAADRPVLLVQIARSQLAAVQTYARTINKPVYSIEMRYENAEGTGTDVLQQWRRSPEIDSARHACRCADRGRPPRRCVGLWAPRSLAVGQREPRRERGVRRRVRCSAAFVRKPRRDCLPICCRIARVFCRMVR